MTFSARGIPIHTRSLSTTLREGAGGAVAFDGYVLDLRKRGAVPVGGYIQGPGIIHHMQLSGTVDRTVPAYREIEAQMPSVAFEASPGTGGESCRDRIGNVAGLIGLPLGDGYPRAIGREIGGVLGCSHILTLAQLLGPTIVWGLERDAERAGGSGRPSGERFFRRDVTVDGYVDGDELRLLAQLNDLHLRPEAECEQTTDRLAEQVEVRVQATLSLAGMAVSGVLVEERRRTLADLETAPWRPRPERAALLDGGSFARGISGHILRGFGPGGNDRPVLDTFLMLAPATIQCLASYRDTWTKLGGSKLAESGGHADSCYMWRERGALQKRRTPSAD
ncbi:MAG: DUF2889 domain-containing protein [Candidatus Binatia bacterium]|nr:DUF2889 domain-containing protein [Candidatus Binatia bacterium]